MMDRPILWAYENSWVTVSILEKCLVPNVLLTFIYEGHGQAHPLAVGEKSSYGVHLLFLFLSF